jgi:maltooligosyltrehalose synthase
MKDVNGYEGLYSVSVEGTIYNKKGKIVGQRTSTKGYKIINLSKDGLSVTHRVHRIVASAYVEGEAEGLQVDHIDGDKCNNHKDNLRWCTAAENMGYYYGYSVLPIAKATMSKEELEESYAAKGRPLTINGEVYRSISNAAKYIADREGKKVDTVKKELKNFMNGKRFAWSMYGKYAIDRATATA